MIVASAVCPAGTVVIACAVLTATDATLTAVAAVATVATVAAVATVAEEDEVNKFAFLAAAFEVAEVAVALGPKVGAGGGAAGAS